MSRRERQLSRSSSSWANLDPERRTTLLIYAGIGLVVLIALAIVGFGYYDQRIAPKHATVLKVGGREFDFEYLQKRANAAWLRNEIQPSSAQQDVVRVLARIETEELTRQAASQLGIQPTAEEVDTRLRARLSVSADAPREFLGERLRAELLRLGLSNAVFMEIIRYEALDEKLRNQYRSEIPTQLEHVNLNLIATRSREKIDQAKARLDAGDRFSVVVVQFSDDPSKEQAGNVGWTPRGALIKDIEDAAFALEPGATTEIIESNGAFYILNLLGKEVRDVSPESGNDIVDGRINRLLTETRDSVTSNSTLNSEQVNDILRALPSRA